MLEKPEDTFGADELPFVETGDAERIAQILEEVLGE